MKNLFYILSIVLCILFGFSIRTFFSNADEEISVVKFDPSSIYNTSPFYYESNQNLEIEEAGSIEKSKHPYLWLDSGGIFYTSNGIGKTIQGDLPKYDYWRVSYFLGNPQDTDNGYHPQNIFRLVTKATWLNTSEEAFFKINKYNLSKSENRNESNGILLFSRYKDQDNTYYSGLRVDGTAVIKRKAGGVYTTLAQKEIIPGYDASSNPNVLSTNQWIGIKSETINEPNGKILINLYKNSDGNWKKILSAEDSNSTLAGKGSDGIRTDFMDVEIKDYKFQNLD
jgi:hypothetical protein